MKKDERTTSEALIQKTGSSRQSYDRATRDKVRDRHISERSKVRMEKGGSLVQLPDVDLR